MLYVELAVAFLLILVNGLLAMAELAIVASRRARLQILADRQVFGSRRALALASNPSKFLSSVQIGITLVGVLSGAFSGATLGLRLGQWLLGLGVPAAAAEPAGVAVVVAVITYLSLIIGELVPKQIALRNPERVAVRVAPAMTMLAKIASPLVWLLDISGRTVLRMLGQGTHSETRVTDEEIHTLVAEAATAGVIEPGERSMIAGVMRLGDRPVRGVMTPRREVEMINLEDDCEIIRETILNSVHSRFPVHDGEPDNVIGVLQAKDFLDGYLEGDTPEVRERVRPAPTVSDTADALDLVEIIKHAPVHMVLIYDEYGHFEGIATNADILEAIIGAARTDEGPPEPNIVRREDGSWLLSGSMAADELADRLGIAIPPDGAYHTAAGFVLDRLGHLPEIGETFDDQGWRFEIVDLDGRRIDKILAKRASEIRRRIRA